MILEGGANRNITYTNNLGGRKMINFKVMPAFDGIQWWRAEMTVLGASKNDLIWLVMREEYTPMGETDFH